jgi:hypothetical protein
MMRDRCTLAIFVIALVFFLFPHGLSAAVQTVELKIATCD